MAQQIITSVANQTMTDLCLQAYGTSDLLVKFCTDNNISSVNYVPGVPQQFVYDDTLVTVQKVNNFVFATAPPPGPPQPVIQQWFISVDHTKCGTTDSSNFTVEVSITSNYLKSIAHGGFVVNNSGYDIQFYSDSAFTSLLNWEIEVNGYDPVAGTLHAWVLLPLVSASVNTVFYMQYGNPAITSFTGGATGAAWNSGYKMIQHFADGTTLSLLDSTMHAHNMSSSGSGVAAGAGVVDGAAIFSGGDVSALSTTDFDSTTGTWSFWLSSTQSDASYYVVAGRSDITEVNGLIIYLHSGYLIVQMAGASLYTRFASVAFIADGNPHYVSLQYNSGGTAQLYIDGVLDTTISTVVWNFNSQVLYIASGYSAIGLLAFHGMIDEFRVRNVNAGFSTQLAEYNNQKNPGNIGAAGFLSYTLL